VWAVYTPESEAPLELLGVFKEAGIAALLSMFVAVFPVGAGLAYVLSPSERRLSFVRPISLAALFAGLAGLLLGFINILKSFWSTDAPVNWSNVAVGAAESMVPLLLAFGALTFAWLCVAVGMRRNQT
jgi:hypothetical protein